MISTSSFILFFLCVFVVVAFLLSLATIDYMIHERAFEITPLQRFGYVILAIILTPFLWIYGIALIIDNIFRQMKKEI